MKSKIITFILTIFMLLLILLIVGLGGLIYLELNSGSVSTIYEFKSSGENSHEDTEENNKKDVDGSINITGKLQELFAGDKKEENYNYSAQNSESNYFYKQLNNYEKKIYNGLQENKENMQSGTYIINYGDRFSSVLSQEDGSEILGDYYQTAIEAFTHDNIDMFYLNVNKMYLNIETTKKLGKTTYNVYIAPEKEGNYYIEGFSSKEQVVSAINEIESVKDSVMETLSGNRYKDILKIHDFLVNGISYDTTYSSSGAYSIYGALVKKTCVCEGYAKAFKYLLNAAGIECEIVQGTATNSSGKTENHAWNCVYLKDNWYLVDTTWDDPIIIGGGTSTGRSKYKYFLKGTETFYEDHQMLYQFTEDGKVFSYPEISKADYK